MTFRLVWLVSSDWARFDGHCASLSFDPLDLPWDRFLSLAYWWATRDAPEDAVTKFDRRLWMPPPGVVPTAGPWTAQAETSAFGAFKRQVSAKPPPRA